MLLEKGLENKNIVDYLFDTYIPSVLDYISYKSLWKAYLQLSDFYHRFDDYLLNNRKFINYVTEDKYIWIIHNPKTFDLIEEYERRNNTRIELSIVFSLKTLFDQHKKLYTYQASALDRINNELIRYVKLKYDFYKELISYCADYPQYNSIYSKLQYYDLKPTSLSQNEVDFLLEFLEYLYNK